MKMSWIPPKGRSFPFTDLDTVVNTNTNNNTNIILLPHLATASSFLKYSPSTIEISSTIRCLHFRHCCAIVFLLASSTHLEMTACPVAIPAKE